VYSTGVQATQRWNGTGAPGDEDSVADRFQGPGGVEAWAIAAPTSALTVTRTCDPATPVMGRTCDLVSRYSDSGPEDLHLFVVGPIDQAVFVVDAAGPVAGQVTSGGFRLTYPANGSRWISPIRRVILATVRGPGRQVAWSPVSARGMCPSSRTFTARRWHVWYGPPAVPRCVEANVAT
jgi:hypothetical protein